jgi:FixJ family two-component response regulator
VEGIEMNGSVWILDGDEDNRTMAALGLMYAGVRALEFASPRELLAYAGKRGGCVELPRAVVVDAVTALGSEHEIRDAVCSRLVVLTTWPAQLAPWLSVGASRFLLKPYTIDALLEHVSPDGVLARFGIVAKARGVGQRQRAA